MVLSSFWGAELSCFRGPGKHKPQTPAEVCREKGFTERRDLLGTDIRRTWAVRGQHFSGDRGLQGTEVCRVQGFAGICRGRTSQGKEVCRGQGIAGWLQAPTEPGPRAVRLAPGTRVLALSASSLTVPGFLGGHRAVITTSTACCVVSTWHRADRTALPQEL